MGITIVGLGPGHGRYLTREAWDVLSAAKQIYVRTKRHPTVAELPETVRVISFDHYYESTPRFEGVYARIVADLMQWGQSANIVYAVPGHPLVGESTVTGLLAAAREGAFAVEIVPGLSFLEPTLTAVGLDGLEGVQLVDAIDVARTQYPPLNPDTAVVLGQVYSRLLAGELKLTLMALYPEDHPVQLVHGAGTGAERVEAIPLYEIDRSPHIDHLTTLVVPPLAAPSGLHVLADTVGVLRSPHGCPWDQEQTPQSMRAGFLEEFSEVLEALDAGDVAGLQEELGDLLYHIVMQTQMAAEAGDFRLTDVVASIDAKLKHRHPHVWGDLDVANSEEVVRNWEQIKQNEKAQTPVSLLDSVPPTLPALAQSQKIQDKVRKIGFDWPDIAGVYDKLVEEVAEIKAADTTVSRQAEIGDALFVIVNLASWLGVDAETALREANRRFSRRFRLVEKLASERQLVWETLDLDALEALWQEAKTALANEEMPDKVDSSS